MKLATFLPPGGGEPLAGEVRGDVVVAFDPPATVVGLLADGAPSPAGGEAYALDEVVLMAPHVPRAIFCIGLNYRRHAQETGREPPSAPIVFLKLPSSVAPPGGPVPRPQVVRRLDYEGARDLQGREPQWTRAKAADGFCPFGPWVTTADEVPDPQDLRLRTWVNGELRQDS